MFVNTCQLHEFTPAILAADDIIKGFLLQRDHLGHRVVCRNIEGRQASPCSHAIFRVWIEIFS
jgi:hypothetical protein